MQTTITTGAELATWLNGLADALGRRLSREDEAAILGVSRSALFAALEVGNESATQASTRKQIPPLLLAHISTLDALRAADLGTFAALLQGRLTTPDNISEKKSSGGRPRR